MADQSPNGGKLWCWVKKRIIATSIVAGALMTIVMAMGVLDQYRWWVWASEFKIVANRVYEATIPEQRRVISSIKRDLERAETVPPDQRDINDIRMINDLEEDMATAQEALNQLVDERTRFKPR